MSRDLPAAFSTRGSGLTPKQLRHPRLTAPTRGLRVTDEATAPDLARALLDVVPPGAALSHVTAARWLGLPTPRPWEPDEPIHLTHATAHVRRPGVVSHRAGRECWQVGGIRVAAPWEVFRDVAADAAWSEEDLVALGDAVVRRWPGTAERLGGAGRGARRARVAAARVRPGSESPGETRCRLLAVDAGLPEPELNVWIIDELGVAVARVDLLWREARVIGEYEGDHHRTDVAQFRKDITRTRRLEALGYRVIRMTGDDLASASARSALADLLRDAVRGRGAPSSGHQVSLSDRPRGTYRPLG